MVSEGNEIERQLKININAIVFIQHFRCFFCLETIKRRLFRCEMPSSSSIQMSNVNPMKPVAPWSLHNSVPLRGIYDFECIRNIFIDIDRKCSYEFSDKLWHNAHFQSTSIHNSGKYAKYHLCRRHIALESMRNRLPFNKISKTISNNRYPPQNVPCWRKKSKNHDDCIQSFIVVYDSDSCIYIVIYQCDESEKMLFIYQLFNASCRYAELQIMWWNHGTYYVIFSMVCKVQCTLHTMTAQPEAPGISMVMNVFAKFNNPSLENV